MANIKFSAFTNQAAADTTYLVGYDGTDNTNYTKAQIKTWLTTGSNAIPTLYSVDGTLSSNRTITMGGNTLSMAQTSGNTVTFSGANNSGMAITGGNNYIVYFDGTYAISSIATSTSDAIVLRTSADVDADTSILIDSRSPGANADLHLKTATKLKIDLPVAATVGYVLKADDVAGNVSWGPETDTTYTGGTDINISASDVINHDTIANTVNTDTSTLSFGGTFDAIDSVTVSNQGHVTAQNTKTYTLPSAQSLPTGADPSATISGTVVNGSATTFMRSDAVPALGSTITIGTAGTTRGIVSIEGGSSSDAQLKLHCSAGSPQHAVTIEGPAHSGGNNYIVKLPTGLPAAGKVLEVDTYVANGGGSDYSNPPLATMKWADGSIYSTNGNLTGARTVTMGAHNLTFASATAGQEVKFQKNVRIDGQSYTPLETISSTASWTPDWDSGNVQTMELTAATTINNPSNIEVGATYIIILKQDSEGSHTVTWGNAYNFPGATAPTLTTGANKADVITLVAYSSTVLMCTSVLDFETT